MRDKPIYAQCPKCGWVQKTKATRKVRCHRCLYNYTLIPRKRRSRIVGYDDAEAARRRRMWGSSMAWDYVF